MSSFPDPTADLTARPWFFCGIGGTGMQPLAAILKGRGAEVAGSDRSRDQGRTHHLVDPSTGYHPVGDRVLVNPKSFRDLGPVGRRVVLTQNSGTIALELMTKVQMNGYRTVEVPVNHYHRAYGGSQFFNFSRVWRTLVQLAGLWFGLRLGLAHRSGAAPATPRRSQA